MMHYLTIQIRHAVFLKFTFTFVFRIIFNMRIARNLVRFESSYGGALLTCRCEMSRGIGGPTQITSAVYI